jgi:hypothetical protein
MEAHMVTTIATGATALGAAINPEQRLACLAARLGHVKTCPLDLAIELTSRSQIQTRERDRSAGYGRG